MNKFLFVSVYIRLDFPFRFFLRKNLNSSEGETVESPNFIDETQYIKKTNVFKNNSL